ncbi:MAG TPA: hypothetical protein VN634_14700 [Candidatus Limnocylindrales bacterium]|nr:hypothetical protein [Candidatus Limnocylindrales bacterium]
MSAPSRSPDATSDHSLALIDEQLASISTRDEWLRLCRETWDRALSKPIRDTIRPDDIAAGLRSVATPESVRDLFGPLLRDLHSDLVALLKKDETALGDYVPEMARRAIDMLLERRDLIPEALVRKLFEQQAVQDAIYDTLYDGLTQFNTSVNPFFADWGLPSFLKRMPIGGSVILASMEALRSEFERRLEPEIRKFLAPFSKRATGQLAEVFLAKSADPKFIQLRKNLVIFLYTQSLAELLARVDAAAAADVGVAIEEILLALVANDRLAARIRDAAQAFVDEHGDQTVGEWLASIGATGDGLVEPWAELLWPAVEKTLASPAARELLRRIVAELDQPIEINRR